MLSLSAGCNGRFQAIATPRVGSLNRLGAIYGGRIFPERTGNDEIGRKYGFSHRQDKPKRLGRRRPPAYHLTTVALAQAFDDLVQRGLCVILGLLVPGCRTLPA